MSPQETRLLIALKQGSVDPIKAWSELGIYRLAAVVRRLKDRGVEINTNRIDSFNRFGESVKFATYTLEEK